MRIEDIPAVSDLPRRTRWGRWAKDGRGNLVHDLRPNYAIPAKGILDAEEMLDWIFQVTGKIWCSSEDAAQLIEALRDTANPQRTLCPFAMSRGRAARRTKAQLGMNGPASTAEGLG